jgi:hypothetical protein
MTFEEVERLKRKEAAEAIEEASAKLRAAGALQVSAEVLTGSAKRTIVEAAEE